MKIILTRTMAAALILSSVSCSRGPAKGGANRIVKDIHSFGNPEQIRITHVNLNLDVLFDQHTIRGTAILSVSRNAGAAKQLIVDSQALQIDKTEISFDGSSFRESRFEPGKTDPILGTPIRIDIAPDTKFVRVRYSTSPSAASALQWLAPEQTAGGTQPFLYTQSEAIHARSWIPLQDSPGVRVTWEARVKVPAGLKAVMSAVNCPDRRDCAFVMDKPVPPYLIALAVSDLKFRSTGPRTGVWAEPPVLGKAAAEFSDMEKTLAAAENLYGPYRWTRYDVLVLPPSFPFGGMENPCLTFATPTVIAGDKSLVSLVAHELAHSWSGNLVTNATWSDFWLNEGFTVYIERRILEALYGRRREEMEAALGYRDLQDELKSHAAKDQILHIDLQGRDPDDGMSDIPYEKGALFLRQIEEAFGRDRFDAYLKDYFDHFAFQSITTAESLDYMRQKLFGQDAAAAAKIPVREWVYQPGLPQSAPHPQSEAFAAVDAAIPKWLAGEPLSAGAWSTQEWLHFLRGLPERPDASVMSRLDGEFHLTATGNDEILDQWLLMAVRSHYQPANARLQEFLTTVGRRKYVKPLYDAMSYQQAKAIYDTARPLYHPITQATIDSLLASKPQP